MNFPGFILPPAGFAMPGGGSLFCPDLRIVPLRHRKRPAPRPSAVSAEKQAPHRSRPHRPHFPPLRAVPPPAPSEPCRGTSRPSHDGLRSRRNPSVPLVFRSRAGRNVPPGIDAHGHRLPASHAARRLFPRFPHMPAETGSGIEKPEGTESSVPGERKRPGHPPTARHGATFRNRQARFGRIRPRVERFPFVRDFFVSLTSS